MKLCQPYYIEKREQSSHINLNGEWNFCWTDSEMTDLADLKFEYDCILPASVYHCLHSAGVLPDPYYGTNSKKFHWVDEKVWYFRRSFTLSDESCS